MAGEVIIAGAGPGNPLLITLQLLEEMQRADVIIHDRLIHQSILKFARRDAEIIFAGKEAKKHYLKQDEINSLLVEKAKEGKRVLRIQGGDPVVFGRTGEELEKLAEAGVPFRLIPGITAGIAVPEYAGIPLTHRKVTSSVMFITGHEDPTKEYQAIDWEHVAKFNGTLVIYMGVSRLGEIMEVLMEKGKDPETPVAVIRNGTFYNQKVVEGKVANIARLAREAGITPPVITVVGGVVKYRKENIWFEKLPLVGKKVVILRSEEDSLEIAKRIWESGGEAVFFPVISFEPLNIDGVEKNICNFSGENNEVVVFTSPRGVRFFFNGIQEKGMDVRCVGFRKIAAIGPSTAEELKRYGLIADIIPDEFVAEFLAQEILKIPPRRVIILRAEKARETLPETLREKGVDVEVFPIYRTVRVPHSPEEIQELEDADYFLFTSSSTFVNLLEYISPEKLQGKAISIGPVTTATMRRVGVEPIAEADIHTIEGIFNTLLELVKNKKGG